jgi:hypothetical protein
MKARAGLAIISLALACLPTAAAAQQQTGIRVGVSGDPDQFVFGGHVETSPLVDRLVFRPTGEVGLGDGLVVLALNFEFAYKIAIKDQAWTPYVGGGPAMNIFIRDDDGNGRGRGGDGTDIGGGFNILVGAEHEGGLFTEFKVGALDSPDLKLLVGFAF